MKRIIITLAVSLAFAAIPASASASPVYMACDNANAPDYEFVSQHPHNCTLGLSQSVYQAQSVPGRSFASIGLRRLRWHRWGSRRPIAYGLACDVYDDGGTDWSNCSHVEVDEYNPVLVLPAGNIRIYQLTRVLHRPTSAEPFLFGYWYGPGVDY